MKYVLLVDEDDCFRLLGRDLLEWFGYRVETARNSLEALSLMGCEVPDLIVCEPAWSDGYQFIEQLRATPEYAWLPVIVLTAGAESQRRRKALRAGANAFIAKPFDDAKLIHCIELLTHQAESSHRRMA